LAVARAGAIGDPPVPPPPALRPYLGFAKQTPRSLAAIARVIERDDDFRARVAAVADESEVGRAGWLWLTRPDGWEAELDELEASTAALAADEQEARLERSAAKRLAAAEAATAKAEAEAAARAAELAELQSALVAEREQRSAAEARSDELERTVADRTEARSEAVRQLKRAEARLVERATEVKALKARLKESPPAAAERAEDGGDPAVPADGVAAAGRRAEVAPPAEPAVSPSPTPSSSPSPPLSSRPPAPVSGPAPGAGASPELVAELARTAEGAALLAEGLAALARRLGAATATDELGLAGGTGVGAGMPGTAAGRVDGAAGGIGAVRPGEAGSAVGRRAPLALPGGVFDDSVEAAEHLLRVPGIVLVVDGYNVSMTGWPDLSASDQRRRLVAALDDLAARTSTLTDVVFDGAEADPGWVASTGRRMVRVRFSSPDVEADDVVIDIVGRLPAATPVVVASSDKRVRDGARRAGANLLHARQLVALLRR
jgi:predicted RNA-binding protein with PIN domain